MSPSFKFCVCIWGLLYLLLPMPCLLRRFSPFGLPCSSPCPSTRYGAQHMVGTPSVFVDLNIVDSNFCQGVYLLQLFPSLFNLLLLICVVWEFVKPVLLEVYVSSESWPRASLMALKKHGLYDSSFLVTQKPFFRESWNLEFSCWRGPKNWLRTISLFSNSETGPERLNDWVKIK